MQKRRQDDGPSQQDAAELWQAYLDSIIVDARDGTVYAGPDAVALPLPPPCYVITAANPREGKLSDAENDRRNQTLEKVLQLRFESVVPVIGRSRSGHWQEVSFLVSTPDRTEILQLAERHHQRAVFELDADTKRVVAVDGTIQGTMDRTQ